MKTEDTKGRGKGRGSWRRHRKCLHLYKHLETKKLVFDDRESGARSWKRIDLFYCQRCLWIKERVLKTTSTDEPEWY
ncbi:hypothetical protein N231_09750 [Geobacillus stearothermophilus ATCC 12980]|nr:hypothetical protein N231_09750 [Geobacillus stearothermophilus ATCC 12980]